MSLYATNRFAGDGATTAYTISFVGGYLDKAHVQAYQEDDLTHVQTPVTLTPGSFVGPYQLAGLPVTPIGSTMVILRVTPAATLVDFTNGSRLTEKALDLATRQGLFVAAEAMDLVGIAGLDDLRAAIEQVYVVAATMDAKVSAAEAALDSFDDRYLGAKAAAPTVDNDGAALLIGALYWDTALPGMRSWNGAAWVTLPAATAAAISNTPAGSIAATTVQAAINELDAGLALKYDNSNILGPVFQNAGVPTGAIIERGSNANGRYVRWADGTMICTHEAVTASVSLPVGSLFASPLMIWVFPWSFMGGTIPNVAITPLGGAGSSWGALGDDATLSTITSFRTFAATSSGGNSNVGLLAVGRWF